MDNAVEKITEDERQVVVRRAQDVRAVITAAGLPAHLAGSATDGLDVRGIGGAIVYYSTVDDDSSGVYVYWQGAPETVAAARSALTGSDSLEDSTAETAARRRLAVVGETMHQALAVVLDAYGWRAVTVDMGGAEELSVTHAVQGQWEYGEHVQLDPKR